MLREIGKARPENGQVMAEVGKAGNAILAEFYMSKALIREAVNS
jgi:hypothetical protein